jgi:peptidyl-prolyl cis-trans isomerase C
MKYVKEPLIIFLLFGAAIFGAQRLWEASLTDTRHQIDITPGLQKQIYDQWEVQMGRAPTPAEASNLLEKWIKEEIYYREAKTLGLDDNDTIIRRRLAQKLTFLNEDLANTQATTTAELEVFFLDNAADYAEPARFSFEHRYFSNDRREDALQDAETAKSSETIIGDLFVLQRSYTSRSASELADLFGRDFAASLAGLDPGSPDPWQGPIRSPYGWHLIHLFERTAPRNPPFGQVSDAVLRDFLQQRRLQANEAFYQQLRSRYNIQMIESASGAPPPA